jgi:hypothetical protein
MTDIVRSSWADVGEAWSQVEADQRRRGCTCAGTVNGDPKCKIHGWDLTPTQISQGGKS